MRAKDTPCPCSHGSARFGFVLVCCDVGRGGAARAARTFMPVRCCTEEVGLVQAFALAVAVESEHESTPSCDARDAPQRAGETSKEVGREQAAKAAAESDVGQEPGWDGRGDTEIKSRMSALEKELAMVRHSVLHEMEEVKTALNALATVVSGAK